MEHNALSKYLCAIEQVWKIEIGDIITSYQVRVASNNKTPPLHQHLFLCGATDNLSAHDGQASIQCEDISYYRNIASLQSDCVGDLNHRIKLWVRKMSYNSMNCYDDENFDERYTLTTLAFNIEAQDTERSNGTPNSRALVWNNVIVVYIHLHRAARHFLCRVSN